MNVEDLQTLINEYADKLRAEYEASVLLTEAQAATKEAVAIELAVAYEDGTIDGKNADVRKQQETAFMANSANILEVQEKEKEADRNANHTKIQREKIYQLISLTKAWLYSQSGVN